MVNGEFYGFEAIQRELEQQGHRLRTRSDSEIALHLYQDLGTHALHQLRGEFAFVLWDETHRTLFAAPRPLRHQAALLRGARRDAVPRLRGEGALRRGRAGPLGRRVGAPRVDLGGSPIRTLFDGVFQVPPGHYLLATERHVQLTRYWDFDYPVAARAAAPRSDEEYAGGVPARRWTTRCGSASGPTCRWVAT